MGSQKPAVPEGFIENPKGGFDRLDMVKPIDLRRDELVRQIAEGAKDASERLATFKAEAMDDVGSFMERSAKQYGAKLGGEKGNVTLFSYDGRYKVQRAVSEHLAFDERLQAAKSLIDECILEWGKDANPEIMTLVKDAFQVDREGKVSTSRILGLRRLAIKDKKWRKAMEAISDSIRVTGSKTYLRVYERNETGGYEPIPLDAAAL